MASCAPIVDTERLNSTRNLFKSHEYKEIYKKEGKLPNEPFDIRYSIAPMTPTLPPGYNPNTTALAISEYLWQGAKPWEIETIQLSVHVNPVLSLEEVKDKVRVSKRRSDLFGSPRVFHPSQSPD